MKTSFTPGPWHIGLKYPTDIYAARAGHAIARTVNPRYAGECEANARLIAAAPEMLTELKLVEAHLHAYIKAVELGGGAASKSAERLAGVRAAIAKATGGAA